MSRASLGTAQEVIDETYNLLGVNLVDPDQIMKPGEAAKADNSRIYAKNGDDKQVAVRTRYGSVKHTSAVGQAADASNSAATTGDLAFSTTITLAIPFTPTASKPLTKIDLPIKRDANAYGPVRIDIHADASGVPSDLLGETSIASNDVGTAYATGSARLMDAPNVVNGTQYWMLVYLQDNGSGNYYLKQTATGNVIKSLDGGTTWSAQNVGVNFTTYLSTAGGVKGYFRRYPSNGQNRTLFAANGSVYAADDLGNVTELDNTLNAGASVVRFDHVQDKTFWVNGVNNPRWYDGTNVTDITNAPAGARNVIIHQGRAFFLVGNALVKFTNLYDFTTIASTNFFYVPDPDTSDEVTGWCRFQDALTIFTHESKHIIYGSDISSFTRRQAEGTLGAVSQEAIAVDKSHIYFMADDKQIYRWNGAVDQMLSRKIEPLLHDIPDVSKVRLHLYRNQLRVYFPSKGSGFADTMALLDLTESTNTDFQWFIDTGRYVAGSLEWTQDNNELVEFSSLIAQAYMGEQGFSDMGKPIDWKYWSHYNIYGSGFSLKRVKKFRPILHSADSNYTMQVGKDMDYANNPDMRDYVVSGGGATWGNFAWGDGTKFGQSALVDNRAGMSGRGKHIQYRFERKGVETPVFLLGWLSMVKVGRPR